MRTVYGIKQKYQLKDFVKYYQSTNAETGEPTNIQFGYITSVTYEVNYSGQIELRYTIHEHPFGGCGYIVTPDRIIRKAMPKDLSSIIKYYNFAIRRCDEKRICIDKLKQEFIDKKKEIESLGGDNL